MDPYNWSRTIYFAPKNQVYDRGQLVCIVAEEDMIAAASSGAPYIEADEKVMEFPSDP